MSDNPFSEPADSDRTVIRPTPGGRRDRWAATEPVSDVAEVTQTGLSPLLLAALPLLQLLARLRNTVSPPDTGDLRDRTMHELRVFERRCREADLPIEQLRIAHYAICATLDEAVRNTPWGHAGGWSKRSLVAAFHPELGNARAFLEQIDRVRRKPEAFGPAIEVLHLCLSLGFVGRAGEFEQLRGELYELIPRNRSPALSPGWQGIAVPYRPARRTVPVWVVASFALALVGAVFVRVLTGLNAASDALFERTLAAPPDHLPQIARPAPVPQPAPPPAPAEPDSMARLREALKREHDAGVLTIIGQPGAPTIRLRNTGMFAAGNATIQPGFVPVLERIGAALATLSGTVAVIGYTDDQPIRTIRFPSNFQLSAARAEAVRAILARRIDQMRLSAEGRADAEPVAPNGTAEGREQNRRIEIVLHAGP